MSKPHFRRECATGRECASRPRVVESRDEREEACGRERTAARLVQGLVKAPIRAK